MASLAVLLDANVLYPAPLRDVLLQLASDGLFMPYWSAAIQDEWISNLLLNRPDLSIERLQRTRTLMETAFPGSMVSQYEFLIDKLHLPDADDRHVLAAAVAAKADFIITKNLHDFPNGVLANHDLMAIHPDLFLHMLIQSSPDAVCASIRSCRIRLTNPPKTIDEYLVILEKQDLKQFVAALRKLSEVLE